MHIRTIVFIIYHLIGVPLFLIYIVQLVLLKIRSEFSSSFYTFFFFGGIIDLLFYTMNVLVYQLGFQPFMAFIFQQFAITLENTLWHQYSPFLSVINLLMFYLPGLQGVTNHLIAGNRLCALCFPLAYRTIFTRNKACIMIAVGMVYSIIYIFPVIGAFGFAVPLASGNSTDLVYMVTVRQTAFPSISMSVYTSIIFSVDCTICLLIYCIIAAYVYKIGGAPESAELRMILLGFAILLVNLPAILYQLCYGFFDSTFAFQTLPWVIMIKTLTPPLLLIATNQQMRLELTSLLPGKLRASQHTTVQLEATTTVISATPSGHVLGAQY